RTSSAPRSDRRSTQLKSNLPQAAALLHRHTCCEESFDGRIGQCSIPIVSPFAILAQEVTAF
ncbi:hypothetical protein, partial [Mesorhizobium sp. M7A.F.Ca.CA.001.14.1.1]|uniref:hypothetical protein n=1 Tax=Mesorhizobium sp. M7A.F.Ca.CA.001.14.1.1 TaxID=2496706 RepID=UPI0019D49450